jgi:hypothetical protein
MSDEPADEVTSAPAFSSSATYFVTAADFECLLAFPSKVMHLTEESDNFREVSKNSQSTNLSFLTSFSQGVGQWSDSSSVLK